MQALVLVVEAAPGLDRLGPLLPEPWRRYVLQDSAGPRELQLRELRQGWFVNLSEMGEPEQVEEDYRSNEDLDAAFRQGLGGRSFVLVSFNDYAVLRALLPSLLRALPGRLENAWVDNDRGAVIRADCFLAKLEADAAWDWRTQG